MQTLKEVRTTLQRVNVVIAKRDGEYRVNLKGGTEATAYYTNDLRDAELTGLAMAETARQYALAHKDVTDIAVRALVHHRTTR